MDDSTIKEAIAQLRKLQPDESAMQQYLLRFIRRGLSSGMCLEGVVATVALGPDSILRRAFCSEPQERRLIEFLKNSSLIDIYADESDSP